MFNRDEQVEKLLDELIERLLATAKDNLQAVVLYGSAATGDYQKEHSDLNILCIVKRVGAAELEALHGPVSWWRKKGYSSPHVFTREELRASADIFALELLDMKAQHRMIYGEDFFTEFCVPTHLLREQVERELRTSSIRLRQGIMGVPPRDRAVLGLMTASASAFITLFRHALAVFGEKSANGRRDVIDCAARICGADSAAFHTILDLRDGKRKSSEIDAQSTLQGYVELVERMTDEVDRRFAVK
jgi:predicted nucleotidyltransferase